MQTVGLIVEYNPMHNGHLYHLQQSKQIAGADAVVAVMSGHFLQRGEPAIVDKWARTDMALANGVDLVLELPTAYAVQPAEWFAHGAVSTLAATGVVDAFCFGSELGELPPLELAAQRLTRENDAFALRLQEALKQGVSFPAAYAQAAAASATAEGGADGAWDWIAEPNNSLGLHYMMARGRLKTSMQPYTIPRIAAGYHDVTAQADSSIASATAVRRLIHNEGMGIQEIAPYVPEAVQRIMESWSTSGKLFGHWEPYAPALFYRLSVTPPDALSDMLEVTEGLEHRVLQALPQLGEWSVEALLKALKTKRYTRTKLQRMLTHILLGHTKESFGPEALKAGPHYIRVLGFSPRGQTLLKRMKQSASLPVVHSVTRDNNTLGGACGIAADVRASAVYAAALAPTNGRAAFRDYYEPPRRCP